MLKILRCGGNHYSMGFSQGEDTKDILEKVKTSLLSLPVLKYTKPRFVPLPLLIGLGSFTARRFFRPVIVSDAKNQAERMRGIADGANVEEKTIYVLNMMENLVVQRKYQACTSFGILPEKCGETILAKNYDIFTGFDSSQVARACKPECKYATLEFTEAFLAGNHNGMNERGLAVLYTMVNSKPRIKGIPPTILIQEVLENCKTTEEATELIMKSRRGRGANYMIADASGDLSVIETTRDRGIERKPKEGFIVSTNHFVSKELRPYDLPKNAKFPKSHHPSLRGVLFHESSESRFARAASLLSEMGKIKVDDIVSILRDHRGGPGNNSICRHHEVFSTLASIILFLERGAMMIAMGNPCKGNYAELKL